MSYFYFIHAILLFTVPSTDPESPPVNVTAEVVSSTSIVIRWDEVPPIDQNGIIIGYELLYEPLYEVCQCQAISIYLSVPSSMITLSGLEEFVVYDFSVRAYTSEGPGPYNDAVTQITQENSVFTRIDCM